MGLQRSKVRRSELEVRDVTYDEIAALQRDGWVKLDRLISSDLATEMLGAATEGVVGRFGDEGVWTSVAKVAFEHQIEPFYSFALGPQMGRNAQRLMIERASRGKRSQRGITAIGSLARLRKARAPDLPRPHTIKICVSTPGRTESGRSCSGWHWQTSCPSKAPCAS
jgi:hypothetical protein